MLKAKKIFVTILALAMVLLLYGCGASNYVSTNVTDYGVYSGHLPGEAEELSSSRSHMFIFPEKLTDEHNIENFYYSCSDGGFDNSYQQLLEYSLPDEEFEAEVTRLAALEITYDGVTNKVKYDTENFKYPAYVTVCTEYSDYEYALIDEENRRIICVMSFVKDIKDLPMNEIYLPQKFPDYKENIWGGYSMYSFSAGSDLTFIPILSELVEKTNE